MQATSSNNRFTTDALHLQRGEVIGSDPDYVQVERLPENGKQFFSTPVFWCGCLNGECVHTHTDERMCISHATEEAQEVASATVKYYRGQEQQPGE